MQDTTCTGRPSEVTLRATPRLIRLAWAASLLGGGSAIFALAVIGGHRFIPDDVYFYLRIADSIAAGSGSTFNGVTPTNGFHPLWELVSTLERLLVGARSHALLQTHLALSGCITLLNVLLLLRFARGTRPYVPIAALFTTLYIVRNPMGSEQHLSLLLLSLLLWHFRTTVPRSAGDLVFGVLLGAALLARLDNVFALAGLSLTYVLRERPLIPQLLRRTLATAGTATLIIAPYFAWNLLHFGHLQPISGAVKAAVASTLPLRIEKLGAQGWLLGIASMMLVAVLVYLKDWRRRDTLLGFGAGACVQFLYVLFRMEAVWTWYYSTELLFVAITLGNLFDRFALRARYAPPILATCSAAMLVLTIGKAWQRTYANPHPAWYLDAGAWLSDNLPQDAVIAATASPGSLAYFTRRPVVALDGLTGDYALQESFSRNGLVPTLKALGVTHIVSIGPRGSLLTRYIRTTERMGHSGEGPAFYGELAPDGTARATAIGLVSGFAGKSVGRYSLSDDNLVGQNFCPTELGVWRFAPRD